MPRSEERFDVHMTWLRVGGIWGLIPRFRRQATNTELGMDPEGPVTHWP
jgi:hypothetical protein